jgi:hypothetical protein
VQARHDEHAAAVQGDAETCFVTGANDEVRVEGVESGGGGASAESSKDFFFESASSEFLKNPLGIKRPGGFSSFVSRSEKNPRFSNFRESQTVARLGSRAESVVYVRDLGLRFAIVGESA